MASAAFTLTTGSGSWSSITKPALEQKHRQHQETNTVNAPQKVVQRFTFSDGPHVEVGEMLLWKIPQQKA